MRQAQRVFWQAKRRQNYNGLQLLITANKNKAIIKRVNHLHKLIKSACYPLYFPFGLNKTKEGQYPIKCCFLIPFISIATKVPVFCFGLGSDST